LFVGMTHIPRQLMLQQGRLLLALILVHSGLFLVSWLGLRSLTPLRGAPSVIYALALSTSATPVFGLAILQPILGPTSAGAVGLMAVAINLTVPLAVILLEINAARGETSHDGTTPNPIAKGLSSGLRSPLLWGPILGVGFVLAGIHLPTAAEGSLSLIGSATSGVAVFAVGLVLAAHSIRLSPTVLVGSFARVSVQALLLLILLHLLSVHSPFAREALVACSFPLATVVVLFAARYHAAESEAASMLLISTLALAITVPAAIWFSGKGIVTRHPITSQDVRNSRPAAASPINDIHFNVNKGR